MKRQLPQVLNQLRASTFLSRPTRAFCDLSIDKDKGAFFKGDSFYEWISGYFCWINVLQDETREQWYHSYGRDSSSPAGHSRRLEILFCFLRKSHEKEDNTRKMHFHPPL